MNEEEIIISQDEKQLAGLGYRQDFKRELNLWSTAAFCFSVMGVVASVSGSMVFPLQYGGHVGMVWGWFTASVFVMFVALCMAELCSAMPTSGGPYYWSAQLAPKRYAPVISWMTGWSNVLGQAALVCSIEFTSAAMITDAASIGNDFTKFYSNGVRYGIFLALLVVHACLCSSATRVLSRLNYAYVAINLGTFVALMAALGALAKMQPASQAFGGFQNNSTWKSNGFAWILSLTSGMWSLTGYDSAAHVAEETANAATVGPWAILAAVIGTTTIGWGLSVMISFCVANPAQLLDSKLYMPIAQMYRDVIGKQGCLALWSLIIVIQFNTAAAQMVDASRVVYAFARDGALPCSRRLSAVNQYTRTPVNAVLFTAAFAAVIGLLGLQSTAMTALSSTSIIALYVSYSVPIILRITYARKEFQRGPWHLGRFGVPIGAVAAAYVIFIVVVLLFPSNPNPDASDMNWAVLILGVILVGSAVVYAAYGRKWYRGPVSYTDEDEYIAEEYAAHEGDMVKAKSGAEEEKPEVTVSDFQS